MTAWDRSRREGGAHLARNVELKVRCDAEMLTAIERRLAGAGHDLVALHQIDTYLRPTRGRLKVRVIASAEGDAVELIAYARPDEAGARLSDYRRVAVPRSEAAALLAALRSTLDELVVVEKHRRVATVGRTRVHLDEVAGLGCFVELETVIAEEDDADEGARELDGVVALLGIEGCPPIAGSYSGLLLDANRNEEATGGGR